MTVTVVETEEKHPEFAVVGKSRPSIDAKEMVRGGTVYASDTSLPGTLEAGLLLSPHAHAKIIRIDMRSFRYELSCLCCAASLSCFDELIVQIDLFF